MCFQGEMAGIEEADNGTRNVALERLCAWRQEEGIVLPPHRQEWRLVCAEVFLEGRIQGDVALVIAEEIKLHFICTGTGQIEIVEVPAVRRHHRRIGHAMRILQDGCLRLEKGAKRRAIGFDHERDDTTRAPQSVTDVPI